MKKTKKFCLDTIFAVLFFTICILICVGIILHGLSFDGEGTAHVFILFFMTPPTLYYFFVGLLCVIHDFKGNIFKPLIRRCFVFIPAIILVSMILFHYIKSEFSWKLAEITNQQYKNVSITIPEGFILHSYSHSDRDVTYSYNDYEIGCYISFVGYERDDSFLEFFEEEFYNKYTIRSYDLSEVKINGREWSYYESRAIHKKVYGYDDGEYFYYLIEDTGDASADFCDQKMDEVIRSVNYKK